MEGAKTRVDKWLWSVRAYKNRSIATDEIKGGKVKINGSIAKPSTSVKEGDTVQFKKIGFTWTYKVLRVIDKRVSSPIAITCYKDITPPDELNKYQSWFVGKFGTPIREKGAGRPTKKERREIDELDDLEFLDDYFEEDV